MTCYSQFCQAKSSFLERSHSPLSINVSNFLFHFAANLKTIQKATVLIHFTRYCSTYPQCKRLLFSSTIISQGNIRDGVQNDPKGLIYMTRHNPKAVVWLIGDLRRNFVSALALVCPLPRTSYQVSLKMSVS